MNKYRKKLYWKSVRLVCANVVNWNLQSSKVKSNRSTLAPEVHKSLRRNIHWSSDKIKTGATGSRVWEAVTLARRVSWLLSITNSSSTSKAPQIITISVLQLMTIRVGLRCRLQWKHSSFDHLATKWDFYQRFTNKIPNKTISGCAGVLDVWTDMHVPCTWMYSTCISTKKN